jgi:hypothetical protein
MQVGLEISIMPTLTGTLEMRQAAAAVQWSIPPRVSSSNVSFGNVGVFILQFIHPGTFGGREFSVNLEQMRTSLASLTSLAVASTSSPGAYSLIQNVRCKYWTSAIKLFLES